MGTHRGEGRSAQVEQLPYDLTQSAYGIGGHVLGAPGDVPVGAYEQSAAVLGLPQPAPVAVDVVVGQPVAHRARDDGDAGEHG
ncbi:hypothetical protein OG268_02970 [Streptomyces uncialis]|nr:hypothetical protein OG268_02970 [Streptomyces uncialis]